AASGCNTSWIWWMAPKSAIFSFRLPTCAWLSIQRALYSSAAQSLITAKICKKAASKSRTQTPSRTAPAVKVSPFDLFLPSSFLLLPSATFCLSLDPPPAIGRVQRHKNDHREIDPAAPCDLLYRQGQRQEKRDDSNPDRDAPARYLIECDKFFRCIQPQRLPQLPGTQIQQDHLQYDGSKPEREDRKQRTHLRFEMSSECVAYSTAAEQKPHGTKNRFQRVHVDQDCDNHRPANEDRDPIFEAITPAPQPMSSPKDSEHDNARDKGRHILESVQERRGIVRNLLGGDHQHGDGK